MRNSVFASEKMSKEYCCTLVTIGEVKPIEGSDFLGITLVEGREIVVRKDQVKEGDVMFYVANECQLNSDFLSVNNMFEDYTLNANADEVAAKLAEYDEKIATTNAASEEFEALKTERQNYLRSVKGYFNKYGRVRMVKLRGVLSMGFLFGIKDMQTWCPSFTLDDIEVGTDFDTINGELFVQAYVPPVKEHNQNSRGNKANKKLARFDKMIPGQFAFHYDTGQLNREINRLKPTDNVTMSVKLHGSSFIMGNILVNKPRWGGLYEKIFLHLPKFLQFTVPAYDDVYSSRRVIQNAYINEDKGPGYSAGLNATMNDYYNILKPYIPEGLTLYGEIIGYHTGANTMIQKGYDYGCKPGENALMLYRVSSQDVDIRREYEVQEVYDWTLELIERMKAAGDENWKRIHPIDILYNGTLQDLYPEISLENHWHENVLEALKNEERFGMEKNEPLCRTKTPREGFVLRITGDPINEAFKLKCLKFLEKEAKDIDSGNYSDEETTERYS